MPKFTLGAPPELLKGDSRDMQQLRHYLMQLCDALCDTLNNLDASNVRAGGLTSASFKDLSVEMLKAAKTELARAKIGWAQVQHLETQFAKICTTTIETADIQWANILALTTEVARIAASEIGKADIDYAKIKDLTAGKAIITKGVNGKLYVTELAVTEANMVSLTTGELVVKGADGHFYAITVDADGNIQTQLKQINNGDVQDQSINAGEKIIEGTVTAACLNARDIFADNALIKDLMAANINVDTLFGREAVLNKINTMDITSNSYLKLMVEGHRSVYTQYDMPEGDLKPGDRWNRMSQPSMTWADMKKLTWNEVRQKKWGEIYSKPVSYVWDGSSWVMTGDEPGRLENPSVLITESGIEMLGGYILLQAGTAIRILSGGELDVEGGTVNIRGGEVNVEAGSAMRIKSGGELDVEGGTVDLKAGSSMRVRSGGKLDIEGGEVNVEAGSAMRIKSGGVFELESDNFSVTPEGRVMMVDAAVSGNLAQDGYSVLTKKDIIISSTAPAGERNRIWVKPLSNVVLTYTYPISARMSFESFNTARKFSLQGSAVDATATTYRYTLYIPYAVTGAATKPRTITATIIANDGRGIAMTGTLLNTTGYTGTLELTAEADFWVGSSANVSFTLELTAYETSYTYAYHRITPGSIQLICSAISSETSGWTDAEVKVYQ